MQGHFSSIRSSAYSALLCLLLATLPVVSQAEPEDFPMPLGLEPSVEFWKKIFAVYDVYDVVLHDREHMKVLHVVRGDDLEQNPDLSRTQKWLKSRQRERTATANLRALFDRVHSKRAQPGSLSQEERRIWNLYRDVEENNKFIRAKSRIRGQRGLRERMKHAIAISGQYLPHMEKVFREAGLPIELTRLPFVESSFNVNAYSSARAAGIWQFIPTSAKIYMRMDDLVDDRRDPFFSTEAAAKHLKDDYARLGTWPLAVTAYNHGRAGVARAVKAKKTKEFMTVISHPRFGFASSNFYAEFLAVLDIERNFLDYFGPLRVDRPLAYEELTTRHYLSFATLANLARMSVDEFKELNRAYHPTVLEGKLYVPPGHRIRVPAGTGYRFRAAYAALEPDKVFPEQRSFFHEYTVQRGENLGLIAQRHNIAVSTIKRINNLDSNLLRPGQTLKIPSQEGEPLEKALAEVEIPYSWAEMERRKKAGEARRIAAAKAERERRARQTHTHIVARGEYLGKIAQRYGTSVAAIKQANGMRGNTLRIGQRLKIPARSNSAAARPGSTYKVSSGDTLSEIAARYNTSVAALKSQNDIASARSLRSGQKIKIPSGSKSGHITHKVTRGQTVASIARKYNSSVNAIKAANNLANANSIRVGQVLKVPSG